MPTTSSLTIDTGSAGNKIRGHPSSSSLVGSNNHATSSSNANGIGSSTRHSLHSTTTVPTYLLRPLSTVKSLSQFQDGAMYDDANSPISTMMASFGRVKKGQNKKDLHKEDSMNVVRKSLGLYQDYPLANSLLAGASKREVSFKKSGSKQLNHVRGTDGWWRSMLVIEVRAMDNYFSVFALVSLNALTATLLHEVGGYDMSKDVLTHWDTVFSLVLKTSLAFLLVFRLNRVAIRFWETRTMWGNVTHNTRNLVGGILVHCRHSPVYRDNAIRWAASFCVAAKHFIRGEHEIPPDELAGVLSTSDISKMESANHAPLYAASMVRYYLRQALLPDKARNGSTNNMQPHLYYANAVQMTHLEELINSLVAQVSGMERVRSTPLPVVYVTHLRTFLFTYLMVLPYVWVDSWGWATIPLVTFAAFALLGIEGASSECEIPFDKNRPNHLAIDAYCMIILDAVQGLVVHDANLDMIERQNLDDNDMFNDSISSRSYYKQGSIVEDYFGEDSENTTTERA